MSMADRARQLLFEANEETADLGSGYDDLSIEHKENDDDEKENDTFGFERNSKDDNAAAFKSAQQGSKSALEFAAVSEQEKSALRLELSGYLTEVSSRRGSDGEVLVHVPANFDEVAESMGRADLERCVRHLPTELHFTILKYSRIPSN